MLRCSASSSTVLLVLLVAVPVPAKRARYYEDEGAAPQRPLGPALGPAYRRRDLADVWESYEDGPRPAALSMRREYRPYWTLADDAPRPASAARYPEEGYYIRRRFAAAPPRKADDAYPGSDPYAGRYAVRWVPVRVDADQDLHQDDADDAPPWPERRKEPPRLDLAVDDTPRRGRRPVELTATEQPKPSRRPPPDATTEDTTAKPLNVHLWVSVDEKTPLLVPGVLQASPAAAPSVPPPPALPPSPQAPQRNAGRVKVMGSKPSSSVEGRSADDMNPGKHIVINNYYQNHAPPGVHDAGLHGDDAAATTETPDDDQPQQQGGPEQSGDVPPPAEATAGHMELTAAATTTRPSSSTPANAADAVEPLAASDLETYLGSDLHDVDDAKPSAHSSHRTASPVHLAPHAHQHTKKKMGRVAATGRLSPGHAAPAAPAGFSGKKRCFSIVLEDKVKRYKETPC